MIVCPTFIFILYDFDLFYRVNSAILKSNFAKGLKSEIGIKTNVLGTV